MGNEGSVDDVDAGLEREHRDLHVLSLLFDCVINARRLPEIIKSLASARASSGIALLPAGAHFVAGLDVL
jgi:hypothetical protein